MLRHTQHTSNLLPEYPRGVQPSAVYPHKQIGVVLGTITRTAGGNNIPRNVRTTFRGRYNVVATDSSFATVSTQPLILFPTQVFNPFRDFGKFVHRAGPPASSAFSTALTLQTGVIRPNLGPITVAASALTRLAFGGESRRSGFVFGELEYSLP
jgi:hypothetical protein